MIALKEFNEKKLTSSEMSGIKGGYKPSTSWDCVRADGSSYVLSTYDDSLDGLYESIDSYNGTHSNAIVGCDVDPIG